MIRIREAIIVEGRYDKMKLSGIVDAPIIEIGGFRVFNDKEKLRLIRQIAASNGIVILTDSDGAGFVIRNFLKGALPKGQVKNCYIPQLSGKEKRKAQAGKEGLLGVEGMTDKVILDALRSCGATVFGDEVASREGISKVNLYELGLTGTQNSAKLRQRLLKHLHLPIYLSVNAMLTALNCFCSLKELKEMVKQIK